MSFIDWVRRLFAGDRDNPALPTERLAAIEEQPCLISSVPIDSTRRILVLTTQTQLVEPNGQVTWYISGTEGVNVSLRLSRVEGSGGHNGHTAVGPAGTLSTMSFRLNGPHPQNVPVVYTAPAVSGLIRQDTLFSNGVRDTDYNQVMLQGLEALPNSPQIVLVGQTIQHPDNHYGTPAFNRAIRALAQEYHSRASAPIYVNDMSLVWGGLFDHRGTWRPPHATHTIGRHADIRSNHMSDLEKGHFREACRVAHVRVVLEDEGAVNEHWHISL